MDNEKTTHTPGPWGWDHHGGCRNVLLWGTEDTDNVGIAECDNPPDDADARLIAAAPDLLEACKFAMHPDAPFRMDKADYLHAVISEIQARCCAAIDKATGDQP